MVSVVFQIQSTSPKIAFKNIKNQVKSLNFYFIPSHCLYYVESRMFPKLHVFDNCTEERLQGQCSLTGPSHLPEFFSSHNTSSELFSLVSSHKLDQNLLVYAVFISFFNKLYPIITQLSLVVTHIHKQIKSICLIKIVLKCSNSSTWLILARRILSYQFIVILQLS